LEGSLPADIRDRVFYLEGDHMHSSIQKVTFSYLLRVLYGYNKELFGYMDVAISQSGSCFGLGLRT
jgi:hypothetical protein